MIANLVQKFDPSDRDGSLQSYHNGVDRVLQTSNSCHNLEVNLVSAYQAVYLGKATTAAMTHSGKGWRRTVACVRDFSFVCNSVCVCTLGCETWVITPRVPSLPRKSSVRLYPADVFLSQTTTSALKMKFFSAEFAPWSCSIACRLYNLAVRKHHFKIHTVLFHCSISGCERLSIIAPSDYLWCLTALVPLAPVAHIPHIDASRIKMALYCQQGSGALRQQLLMMHGSSAWNCMVLHGMVWYCMVL